MRHQPSPLDSRRPLPDRLAQLDSLHLDQGASSSFDEGHCALEVVAWLAGEEHSDHPQCTSAVVGDFVRSWNDRLPDEDRDRLLKPLLPCLVGSAGDSDTELARSYLALDWLIRVHTPAWLDVVESLKPHAAKLRGLGEITDLDRVNAAQPMIRAAGNAAGAIAGDGTRVAAWDAARVAARVAAGNAAGAAAGDGTRAAVWDGTRAAAWDAAWDAAGVALKPIVLTLQDSARDLVCRMLAVGESA